MAPIIERDLDIQDLYGEENMSICRWKVLVTFRTLA